MSELTIEVARGESIDALRAELQPITDTGFHGNDLRWLSVLAQAFGHKPYLLVARRGPQCVGLLPLTLVSSPIFGRHLVSLPYLNSAGVLGDEEVANQLVSKSAALADELDVKHMELRQERRLEHERLTHTATHKVHMRLSLPATSDELWKSIKAKVRNQLRKGQQQEFSVRWGGREVLDDFYAVFSRNMRDLGTPVYGKILFRSILEQFGDDAELCTVHLGGQCVAGALLVHGSQATEVPSASALREYNSTNANMFMYWQLLERAVQRGQGTFDFGRSSPGAGPHRFKKQWGAEESPAIWQYYVRKGSIEDTRADNEKFGLAIKIWRRLPVPLTRWLGPAIVKGIP